MKMVLSAVSLFVAMASLAQDVKIPPLIKYETDKTVLASNSPKPHILFVNVGKAVDAGKFRDAVCAVWADSHVNVAVSDADKLPPLDPFAPSFRDGRFSESSKLLVYVVNMPDKARFVSMPGNWAVVNVNGFDANIPKDDLERYDRRLRQLMLKGFGLAMGLGMSSDPRCALYFGSNTPETIDKVSLGFGFDANSAMVGILMERFGEPVFDFPKE